MSLFIFFFYFFFNLNFLSDFIDEKGDALTYDNYVRLGIPRYLYNPHHLAFDWVGKKIIQWANNNGFKGTSMVLLQLRNLFVSSLFLSVLFIFLYVYSKKILLSLSFCLLTAFSLGYWIYSQINDTPIIHSVLIASLFLILLQYRQVKKNGFLQFL